jgi:NAD(P)-dependent dehydrogenase (short-subunit alcohol dehydrogenase family)
MLEDLNGQVAVVTGGARGLGFSMAGALARLGVHVALLDMLASVTDSASALAADRQRTAGLQVDVTSEDALAAAFAEVGRELGSPTILINAAGITTWEDSLEGTKASWSKVIEVNLTGTYLTCQAFGRACRDAGHGGAIVNVSSMSATVVNIPQHQVSYHASKAGVDMMTKALAVEWAPLGIRVNAVAPGYMLSDMTRQFTTANPDLAEQWRGLIPAGRMGEPADLDGLVALLCSSASSYLTGQSIVIDGGYTAI